MWKDTELSPGLKHVVYRRLSTSASMVPQPISHPALQKLLPFPAGTAGGSSFRLDGN